jgi:putative DNA primase/helicase
LSAPSDHSAIPLALRERKQWLVWRFEPGETPEKKPRKMPYYANGHRRTGEQGSEPDRAALTTCDAAIAAAGKGGFDGIGFAFLPGDGLIGIDLDGMINSESGEIAERCTDIITACASYTEYSPSGKGVHIICLGQTETFKSNKVGIEVFCGRQYFTFTAKPWPGSPADVRPISDSALRRLRATVKGKPAPSAPTPTPTPPQPSAQGVAYGGRQRSVAESVALAEEAIGFIDANEYELWIEVGMACKAGLGMAGFYVWDAWSATSQKYAGDQDTRKRWEGFKPNQLTLGTLFSLAEQGGWVSPWAKARARKTKPKPPKSAPPPAPDGAETAPNPLQAPAEDPDDSADRDWPIDLLKKKGDISPCLANAELILSHMAEWKDVIAYDEFAERTVYRKPVPCDKSSLAGGDWSDHLDDMATIWLQRKWGVEFSTATVGKAVEVLARGHRFHPVREALEALPPWDGVRRAPEWLTKYLGVARTEYTELVGAFFLRGMIKRVMEPGCKFDYCLVLEGEQGKGKSSVARVLSWNWFCDTDLDLSNKDSLLALPGHWVYEIAELGSLMKAEERKQKSFLSRQEDEFRPPYGKRLIKVPRQSVFIGTTNEEEYLKDATGGRRFWPVMCGDVIDLDGLRAALEQLFAEALHDYREKERCWPLPAEQALLFSPEQAKRGVEQPLEELLRPWVEKQMGDFSMAEAAVDCLKLTADKLTVSMATQIGVALRKLGCERKQTRSTDPGQRRLYVPPSRLTPPAPAADDDQYEGGYVPF